MSKDWGLTNGESNVEKHNEVETEKWGKLNYSPLGLHIDSKGLITTYEQ